MSSKFTFVIADLTAGGAQRVASLVLNGLAAKGYEIDVLCLAAPAQPFFPLHPTIRVHYLDLLQQTSGLIEALKANCRRVKALREAIAAQSSDTVLSFVAETNILTAFAARGLGKRVLVSERADPRLFPQGLLWRVLRPLAYAIVDTIVCQTQYAARYFRRYKTAIAPNPVLFSETSPLPLELPERYIVTIGRFDAVKNYPSLIRSFQPVAAQYPDLHLVIVGDGPEKQTIEDQIASCGLQGRVHLPGPISNPKAVLEKAALFVLPSLSEGMPNVLLEAMTLGIASVATHCTPPIDEIITHGLDGIIIPVRNESALSIAMGDLYDNPNFRRLLGENAKKSARRYAMDDVLKVWERIINPSQAV